MTALNAHCIRLAREFQVGSIWGEEATNEHMRLATLNYWLVEGAAIQIPATMQALLSWAYTASTHPVTRHEAPGSTCALCSMSLILHLEDQLCCTLTTTNKSHSMFHYDRRGRSKDSRKALQSACRCPTLRPYLLVEPYTIDADNALLVRVSAFSHIRHSRLHSRRSSTRR
jgi:hypothetical protein